MNCDCARCRQLATANEKYGYDEAAVAGVECLICGKPIGDAEYVEYPVLARFGQMFFIHKACDTEARA